MAHRVSFTEEWSTLGIGRERRDTPEPRKKKKKKEGTDAAPHQTELNEESLSLARTVVVVVVVVVAVVTQHEDGRFGMAKGEGTKAPTNEGMQRRRRLGIDFMVKIDRGLVGPRGECQRTLNQCHQPQEGRKQERQRERERPPANKPEKSVMVVHRIGFPRDLTLTACHSTLARQI